MITPTPALLADRTMKARRQSLCPSCKEPIQVGQSISRIGTWMHTQCAIGRRRASLAAAADALTNVITEEG